MDRRRLAGVSGPGGHGSGYAVGGRLVLTSAHVVGPTGTQAEVFHPAGERAASGRVVWRGTPGGRDDAALVLVDDDPCWQPPVGPVRWGRSVTNDTGIDWVSWGIPDVAQRGGQAVEAAQLSGKWNPGHGFVSNKYVMDLCQHPPQRLPDGASPWGGMSGAAVFCDRLLVGVVASEPAHSGGGQLNVVPAYVLHNKEKPAFRATLAEHGAGSEHSLEAVELQLLTDSAHVPGQSGSLSSPAALLEARHQTVPFHGRKELLGDLEEWCSREVGFGARLLHGPGGQGKTRLAHQLAARLAPGGWVVLWPKANADKDELKKVGHVTKPLLVILDYAEGRAEQLAAMVEAASDHSATSPLRLLLLARTDGEWWDQAISATRLEDHPATAPPLFLGSLEDDPALRTDHYLDAARALATALSMVPDLAGHDWPRIAAGLPLPPLDQSPYSNALTLQMAALADLLDTINPPGAADAIGDHPNDVPLATDVEDRLLRHESRYWLQNAKAQGLTQHLRISTLKTALAAAHLVSPDGPQQADQLWLRLPRLRGKDCDLHNRVTTWLSSLYPSPAAPLPWGTLQPGRLAERHVGRVLSNDPDLAEQLLNGADQAQTERLLTVYSRAAAHPVFRVQLAGQLTALCRSRLDLGASVVATAIRTDHPAPLITALNEAISDPDTSLADLETLSAQFPRSSQRLAAPAVHLSEALTHRYRMALAKSGLRGSLNRNTYLPGLARSLHYLSMRLGEVGRRKEALAAIEEAVKIRHGLVKVNLRGSRNRNAYLRDLAQSLNNLSDDLRMAGRQDESLAAIKKASKIRHSLAKANPNAYLPDIAESLNNLSIRQRHGGQRDDRLAAIKRATEHYRGLAKDNPNAYLPKLALSLNNLSNRLGEVGRRKEALAAIEEAVEIRRGLAKDNPDAYLPDLALSLNNLSIQQWQGGQRDDGLAAIKEAVQIQRHLAKTNPLVSKANLRKSLEVEARLKDLEQ
ncbi:tetratricopeptide repeat-containing serine protease family protein [Streptomyces sp. NBC_00439]|uniref:tetratricopeptide repeat-containing S1 family peptidase n=1 Tax=Streptomyces sp. NBC_00439 TaxID=2903650 RepID=UPI002251C551|nr:tetratricopeptide repeat-containing serine protease family protein [Streptomyces sp. NBC_00439]MCX5100872.1 tetratricopeptide repeat-containing serine protease family protein [Streptomyces sp. NBC_00439]